RRLKEKSDASPRRVEVLARHAAHVLPVHQHATAVRAHETDNRPQRHALAGSASSQDRHAGSLRHGKRHLLEDMLPSERLTYAIELHGDTDGSANRRPFVTHACDRRHDWSPGKKKKISRTRITLDTMIRIEEKTTDRVDARP